jgi:4-amino-4-deoxy-L-arabinose transferase-like glycosyltransferase
VLVALLAQFLISLGLHGHGRAVYLAAAVLAWIAFSRIPAGDMARTVAAGPGGTPGAERDIPGLSRVPSARALSEGETGLGVIPSGPRRLALLVASAAGLLGAAIAARLVATGAPGMAQWIWLGSIGILIVGAAIGDGLRRRPTSSPWSRRGAAECALVLAILALAALLASVRLDAIPPEVHGDEAATGLQVREIIHGERASIFEEGRWHIPLMHLVFRTWTMQTLGDSLVGLRAGSAIQGVLSVLVLYLLVRELFRARVAVLASFLLAVAQWHIHFSRVGETNVQALLATLLVLLFVVRGVRTGRILDWLLAGLAVGFCMEIYLAARLAPIVAALYVARVAWTQPSIVRSLRVGLAAALVGAGVFLAPMIPVLAGSADNVVGRGPTVLVLTPRNSQHQLDLLDADSTPEMLLIQAWRTLEAFNIFGETSDQYHHQNAPLLDLWTAALLVVGAVAMLRRITRPQYTLLNAWVWLTLIVGGALTIDAPFSPRLLVVLPALVIVAAIALESGWATAERVFARRGRVVFGAITGVVLMLALAANYHDYFDLHIVYHQPAGSSTVLSRFVRDVNQGYRVYLIGPTELSLGYDTQRFLIPNADALEVPDGRLAIPLTSPPEGKGAVFVFTSEDAGPQRIVYGDVRAEYPGGRSRTHLRSNGEDLFTSYTVEHAELVAAAEQRAACVAYQGDRTQTDSLTRCIGSGPPGN